MNVLDSSCWLEYIKGTKYAKQLASIAENMEELVVPTICLYEVSKKILQQKGEDAALEIAVFMQTAKVVAIDEDIALYAADISVSYNLPMADSLILATTWRSKATLWTMDSDFKGIDGVKYIAKK